MNYLINKSLQKYNKPTVWTYFSKMAIQTKSANLGQGFPTWDPPTFYLQEMAKSFAQPSVHQYARAFGIEPLVRQVASMYSQYMGREINPLTEVVITAGGVNGLCGTFGGTLNPGDEVLLIEPFYDCYQPQIEYTGAKVIGVPMKPSKAISKQQVLQGQLGHQWELDLPLLQSKITPNTKYIVMNNPHNPTGKVFQKHQVQAVAQILRKHPQVNVIMDQVYEHITFQQKPFGIHRLQLEKGMFDRCLTICSAGKLFSATGVRIGWVIGPERLVKPIMTFNQYNTFCLYAPIQNSISESLKRGTQNNFFQQQSDNLKCLRDVLLAELAGCKYNWKLWVPQGGYFVLADISQCQIDKQFMIDEDGNPRSRDIAFSIQLCRRDKVVAIPCSVFYTEEHRGLGANLVRFAFCKDGELIKEAGRRMQ